MANADLSGSVKAPKTPRRLYYLAIASATEKLCQDVAVALRERVALLCTVIIDFPGEGSPPGGGLVEEPRPWP